MSDRPLSGGEPSGFRALRDPSTRPPLDDSKDARGANSLAPAAFDVFSGGHSGSSLRHDLDSDDDDFFPGDDGGAMAGVGPLDEDEDSPDPRTDAGHDYNDLDELPTTGFDLGPDMASAAADGRDQDSDDKDATEHAVEAEGETDAQVGSPVQKLRRYQLELCRLAMMRNIIVYLETGEGKTLIAIHVIKRVVSQLRQRRARVAELEAAHASALRVHTRRTRAW